MEEMQYDNDEGTFSVSHRRALSHHMPSSHFHSTYEIYYLISGRREFFIKDRTMVIEEGDVIIVAPNILHRTTNASIPQHERLTVNMHESCMAPVNKSYKDALRPLFEQEYVIVKKNRLDPMEIETLARGIIGEIRDRKPGFEMYAQILVLQLLMICCRHAEEQSASPAPAFPSPMHARISEIVRYINEHYAEGLSLALLAEKFYVSPYYLSHFFKEATGFTFVEYLNSVRVKEAKALLAATSLQANQIAKKVGFGSVTHFGRVFKLITGHAPLFYRRGN